VIVPIPVYAILGHLASGLVILGACEAAFDGKWLIDRQWTPGSFGLCGVTAYLLGRLCAVTSRFVVERWLVRGVFGAPECVLLTDRSRASRGWKKAFFPTYFQNLPHDVREQALQWADEDGFHETGPDFFAYAQSVVEEDRFVKNRLGTLVQMSGICRSMCIGLVIVAAILVTGIFWHSLSSSGWGQAEWRKLGYCALSLIEAAGMFYRHLRFIRQHAAEVFVGYSR